MITETEIIDAIKKNEFTFFYQPKVSLITGKVMGAEALLRWIKPDGSVIAPGLFIPVAEQSDLIKDITRYMFPKLVSDLLVLLDLEPLCLSFNASAKDFEDDTFTTTVLNALETYQLPGDSLQVEITETATLAAGDKIKKNILPLRQAGLGLSMDDFGKGYSSIDTLSQWPFTDIKLDQGIIGRMLDSAKNLTIVQTSVRMAHELGISVIAEGVENQDQYLRLLEAGCTKIQGFWISQALPLDQYILFVKTDFRWSGMPIGLIHMAIIDHVQWRKKLVSEMVKAVSSPKDSHRRKCIDTPPLSYKECHLGRWYYGVGQIFQDRLSFQNLEKSHCDFHAIATLLVKMVEDGSNMEDILDPMRELSESSMKVLTELQKLEDEGLIEMHATRMAV